MRLLKVKLTGIRRFEESDALHVGDRIVAIVGPNESGKTSLLRALAEIKDDGPLPAGLQTRRSDAQPEIRALFALSDEDRESLAAIRQGSEVRRCWLRRNSDGVKWTLEPWPLRDLEPRKESLAATVALSEDPFWNEYEASDEHPLSDEVRDEAMAALASDADTLTEEQRLAIGRLANALGSLVVPDLDDGDEDQESIADALGDWAGQRAEVVDLLHALGVSEAEPSPRSECIKVLRRRLPTIIEFTDEDRNLRPDYDLSAVIGGDGPRPAALVNLAELAGLDLDAFYEAVSTGDVGTERYLREEANKVLRERFDDDYGQSDACVQFESNDTLLQLVVHAEGGTDFVPFDYRSAGYQWFVAMTAFLAHERAERPLLLIDEIERHLHYDAQADLLDVLTRQTAAEQVIYTTHSAGALPPDLGTGVRAVVPVRGQQRSRIDNSFWTSGPGFTPILFGLGASTLPFSIPERVAIAEGGSDAVLLPTLIRRAVDAEGLEYRIAPGVANTSLRDLHRLDARGGRVAYVLDGDADGERYRDDLIDVGVDAERIIRLSDLTGQSSVLEDLLEVERYVEAVREELEPYSDLSDFPAVADFPDVGRPTVVEEWCDERAIDPPSKVRVAQRIVAVAAAHIYEGTDPAVVLAPSSKEWLAELDQRLRAILDP